MILFIDDEPHLIKSFVQAFELSQFETKVISSIDEAGHFIIEKQSDIDVIILDVMMAKEGWGDIEGIGDGLRAGVVFLDWLKEENESLPVILLTNANKSSLIKTITHRNYLIFEKKEIDPWTLVEKMSDIKRRTTFDD